MKGSKQFVVFCLIASSLFFGFSASAADYKLSKDVFSADINQAIIRPNIIPVVSSSVHAEDVIAGSFGANVGGGNYFFPSSVQIGAGNVFNGSGGNSYFNSGNVGIGTINPGAKLEINGDIRLSGGSVRTISVGDNSGSSGDNLYIQAGLAQMPGSHGGSLHLISGVGFQGHAGNVYIYPANSYGNVIIASNGNYNMGKVGIGIADPDTTLHVNGSLKANSYYAANGSVGISNTYHLKANTGQNCTMTFSNGLLTASTCP